MPSAGRRGRPAHRLAVSCRNRLGRRGFEHLTALAPDSQLVQHPVAVCRPALRGETGQGKPLGHHAGFTVPGGVGNGSNVPLVGGIGPGGDTVTAPPPPATPPPGPVRPGGDIKFPSRTFFVSPAYPSLAKSARIEGTVYLEATIDANGIVRDVKVLKSIPLLDEAAKAAVSQWRYTPTKLNGVAVPVILTVTVTFTLK